MSKEIIAVDLDDVLGDEKEAVRLFVNERFNRTDTAKDYLVERSYRRYWQSVWGVDNDLGSKMYKAYAKEAKGNHSPKSKSLEVINFLKTKFELIVVTARDDNYAEITHKWLEKHFPNTFKDVKFVPVWEKNSNATKAEVCRQIGAGYLIDDSFEHCKLAAEAGVKALLFGEYGWNRQTILPAGVERVKNWQEVAKYFEKRS